MKLNLKNLKNLKKGFKELTPLQLSKSRIWGYVGMVIALIVIEISMLMSKNWLWFSFLVFVLYLQIISLIGEYQSCNGLKEMEATQKNEEDNNDFIVDDVGIN